MRRIAVATLLLAVVLGRPETAETVVRPEVSVRIEGLAEVDEERVGAFLAVNADDDDANRRADHSDASRADPDAATLVLEGRGPLVLRAAANGDRIRVTRRGRPIALPLRVARGELPLRLGIEGVRASERPRDVLLVAGRVDDPAVTDSLVLTVVGLAFLDGSNEALAPTSRSVQVSRTVAVDGRLPAGLDYPAASPEARDLRLEVFDASAEGTAATARLESVDPTTGATRDSLDLPLGRPDTAMAFRSPFVRIVADEMDEAALTARGALALRVALRDEIRMTYRDVQQSIRVGRPAHEEGPEAVRIARVRVRVVRTAPGGAPAVGQGDDDALRIARDQIVIANEIWAQCNVTFGDPASADVAVVDPPEAALLAIANGTGARASGGEVRLRAAGRTVSVRTQPGWTPLQTATAVAERIRSVGLRAKVTENAPLSGSATRSADVLVRDRAGRLVHLEPVAGAALTTDPSQTVAIGRVDLGDGLTSFGPLDASAGTIEERALLATIADDDARTIDLVLVNRFARGGRQGEAFIEGDDGALVNMVVLDASGIRQQRMAWTQSHEIGHVLLNQPFHSDTYGADRPWLLMDADASLGTVYGPKRLSDEECARARRESGPGSGTVLLARAEPPRGGGSLEAPPWETGYPRPAVASIVRSPRAEPLVATAIVALGPPAARPTAAPTFGGAMTPPPRTVLRPILPPPAGPAPSPRVATTRPPPVMITPLGPPPPRSSLPPPSVALRPILAGS